MRDRRSDFERISITELQLFIAQPDFETSFQDKEQLSGFPVVVFYFAATRRDEFLYNREIGAVQESPAIASRSPRVVFCIGFVNK